MPEYGTCIDSIMHDNGCCNHTQTNHTSYRKVRTCQQDQAGNTKCKEHTRGCLLQDIQDVGNGQQLCIFNNRCDDTQCNKNQDDYDVQAIFVQKLG